jgi:hypothetical protein
MSDIKRIKNRKLSITSEKLKNDWNEVKSFRNRLLQSSDWVFVPDANLDDNNIQAWKQWRLSVRRVDDFSETGKALIYLKDLQANMPPVVYKNTSFISTEHYKIELQKQLRTIIKAATDNMYGVLDTRELLMERFDEALKFQLDNTTSTVFIDIEANRLGVERDVVAKRFLKDRENYVLKLVTIENTKNKFLSRINSVETIKDCDMIRDDLLILGSKKWI